jgi:hypothetical protein
VEEECYGATPGSITMALTVVGDVTRQHNDGGERDRGRGVGIGNGRVGDAARETEEGDEIYIEFRCRTASMLSRSAPSGQPITPNGGAGPNKHRR